jgi:hypothetical protein
LNEEEETDALYIAQIQKLDAQVRELHTEFSSQNIFIEAEKKLSGAAIEESESLRAVNDCLQIEIDNLTNRIIKLEDTCSQTQQQITSLEFNRALNDSKIQAQQDEIQTHQEHSQKFQTWAASAKQINTSQSEKIKTLKEELEWAVSQGGQPVVDAFKSTKELQSRVEELQTSTDLKQTAFEEWKRTSEAEVATIKASSASELQQSLDREAILNDKVQQLEAQFADCKDRSIALQIERDEANTELASVKKVNQSLQVFTNNGFTPRKVIFMGLMKDRFPENATRTSLACSTFLRATTLQLLTRQSLDVSLEHEEAQAFQKNIEQYLAGRSVLDVFQLKLCSICRIPKLAIVQGMNNQLNGINEFFPRFSNTTCCSSAICSACLPEALICSTQTDWWHNLESPQWLKCPVPQCTQFAPVRHVGELMSLALGMGTATAAVTSYVKMKLFFSIANILNRSFERATVLRSVLQTLSPRPNAAALVTAS